MTLTTQSVRNGAAGSGEPGPGSEEGEVLSQQSGQRGPAHPQQDRVAPRAQPHPSLMGDLRVGSAGGGICCFQLRRAPQND